MSTPYLRLSLDRVNCTLLEGSGIVQLLS